MRILSWIIAIPVALVAVSFALTNRETVTLGLWPLPYTTEAPLFLAILLALLLGFLVGGFIAWANQHRNRSAARREARRAERLERELQDERAAHEAAKRRLAESARQLSDSTARLPVDAVTRAEVRRLAAG